MNAWQCPPNPRRHRRRRRRDCHRYHFRRRCCRSRHRHGNRRLPALESPFSCRRKTCHENCCHQLRTATSITTAPPPLRRAPVLCFGDALHRRHVRWHDWRRDVVPARHRQGMTHAPNAGEGGEKERANCQQQPILPHDRFAAAHHGAAPPRRRAAPPRTGCNANAAGRWPLVAGRWSLVAGRWSLVAGRRAAIAIAIAVAAYHTPSQI